MKQPDVELHESLELAVRLIDALIEERPMLAAKMVGSTTLGNHRADLKAVVVKHRPVESEGRVYGLTALEEHYAGIED
jgi:hypothetical protein